MKNLVQFNLVLTSFTTQSLVYTKALYRNLFIEDSYLILHSLPFKFYIFSLFHQSQSISQSHWKKWPMQLSACMAVLELKAKRTYQFIVFNIEEKQKQAAVEKLIE